VLGALDAWNFSFAAFVFGAWGLLLFVFWRFFGFASFLFFFSFLFWSFGFASSVFYMTESCAFVKFVFCLLSVVGEERETSLLLEKNFSNGTSSLASKQCQQATSNGLEIMIL